ncbi:MAG: hypothetical protein HQL29_01525 [Candidatus Omnitrophica bacterium]|nr:hypothetical protein [Candidatus Omnitrophota bacterium]
MYPVIFALMAVFLWTATVISSSIFLFGCALVHLKDGKNKAQYNTGPVLIFDILIPFILITLLVLNNS